MPAFERHFWHVAPRERHNIRFVDMEESNTGLQTRFGRQAPFGIKSLPSSVVVVIVFFSFSYLSCWQSVCCWQCSRFGLMETSPQAPVNAGYFHGCACLRQKQSHAATSSLPNLTDVLVLSRCPNLRYIIACIVIMFIFTWHSWAAFACN